MASCDVGYDRTKLNKYAACIKECITNAVTEFVASARSTSVEKVTLNKSLFHDLGIDGDDAVDLINGFAAQFDVSLEGFDFQEYFGPEATSGPIEFFVELLTKEKYRKLRRLEIADLVKAASVGRFSEQAEI
jgi:acyl carrier protein